jgi:ribonuclease D
MIYKHIKNNSEFSTYLSPFQDKKTSTIAMDIEAETNLHAYGERLCLIQAFDGQKKVLIDPFNIDNDLIKSFFEDRNILKVIYDASSDLSLMKNAYGIEVKSVLDLRPAVALLNLEKQDLHSVIASELGVYLEKKAKFQKHDWTKRPISGEAIEYALNDVTYLLQLKDVLLNKLHEKQLMESFILNNLKIQNKDYTRSPGEKYNRISGYQKLKYNEKLIAQEVSDIIEKYARLYNIPAYWVIKKNDIVEIVKDANYVNSIHFPKRFSADSTQSILSELRSAVKGRN